MKHRSSIFFRHINYLIIIYFCLNYFSACKEDKKGDTAQTMVRDSIKLSDTQMRSIEDSLQEVYNKVFEETGKRVEVMNVQQPIRHAQPIFFSSKQAYDEFAIYIPAGPVGETKSIMTISTAGKDLLFSDTIHTSSLAKWIIEPDSTPDDLDRLDYLRFVINYLNRLSDKDLQTYLEDKAEYMFDEIVREKTELKEPDIVEKINRDLPKELFDEVMTSNDTPVIFWPCYDCDENGRYMAYSKSKKKVIILALPY